MIAVLAARAAAGHALGAIALSLCLPLVGIGFSFTDVGTAAGLALVIVLGSAYGLVISLLWPAGHAIRLSSVFVPPPRAMMVRFGYLAGAAGAVCAAVGFALDLEHVGWATGAALLVMRPAPRLQEDRSIARVVDVVVGASVAIALVTGGAPAWAYSVAIAVAVVCVTATAGSRWYVHARVHDVPGVRDVARRQPRRRPFALLGASNTSSACHVYCLEETKQLRTKALLRIK